ncbi:MAG: HlyC/CorC family transporter [Clostridium argentinense]|uniref:HlyC/CorC family transporter n=1 Tax=Clostridium faecium TaxID=2762223 RepID=A0ABR8YPN3_9CLOT|nr:MULTISPECIES: hemolysin family protein [Clostridium]MBD8045986.1 HlyC/CorC family transporter [Clostridium faecium]MBS5823941.1 HlyC/CorC family transporter [Clostridium argentinense]MDU1349536.1 hemolysin family protein [Clostridium argentinense]
MEPGSTWQLIILIILIGGSAFFSASETALMSLNKIRLRNMVDEGIKGADKVQKLNDNPSKLLGTLLVGNNIVNIASSSIATAVSIKILGAEGVAISTIVMTIIILIFGEITPKTLASQNSEKISLIVAPIISVISIILKPLVVLTTFVANIFISILGGKTSNDVPLITEAELKTIVDVSEEEGILEEEEKEIIHKVFGFGDLYVKDAMVQRVDVIAVELNSTFEEIMQIIKEEQFSRIPVYQETIDNIVGILYVKDILMADFKEDEFRIKDHMRKPYYTYEYKKVIDLFKEINKSRQHMNIVLDEYGGTVGIITIEDMLEEIVGEIDDEYDEQHSEIVTINDNEYLVDGSVKIEDINDLIGTDIHSNEFDSIGGFIIGELGKFPQLKQQINFKDKKFIVEEIEKNRIKKVKILL